MKQIIYKPVHGSLEPVQAAGVELTPGVSATVTDDQADELLRNQFMVDAATGKNENFVCRHCGADTSHDGVFDPVRARTQNSPIHVLVGENGRVCPDCRFKTDAAPPVSAASSKTISVTTAIVSNSAAY